MTGPLAPAMAARLLAGRRDRAAGALLAVSTATPVWYAWPLVLPALLVGAALLVAPPATVRPG